MAESLEPEKSKRKNRRVEYKNINKNKKTKLRLVGVNANGIKSKMISFQRMISELKPGVFFLQETKLRKEGYLENEVDGASQYRIYEHLRKAKSGGGLAIGVAKELNSAWLCEGDDDIEFISVMIHLKNLAIRCVNAYGPQEKDLVEKKREFWANLDSQVEAAELESTGFVLQMDGNLWAGPELINGDPNEKN